MPEGHRRPHALDSLLKKSKKAAIAKEKAAKAAARAASEAAEGSAA